MISNYIESRAEKLLSESGALTIPVNLNLCASFLNITLNRAILEDDVSGFLLLEGDTANIGYNHTHKEHRFRFTIAHEIGHFILHKKNARLFVEKSQKREEKIMFRDSSSSTGEYIKEREANSFAAALLMPRKAVESKVALSNKVYDEDLIDELAEEFNVSRQAMGIRLSNLGIVDYDSLTK